MGRLSRTRTQTPGIRGPVFSSGARAGAGASGYNRAHFFRPPTEFTVTQSSAAPKVYEVTRNDLPLSCPGKFMTLWNMHPKVYLPIEKTGSASCPYCGAQYKLSGK